MSAKTTVAKIVLGSALAVGAIAMSGCAAGSCGAKHKGENGGKCGSAKADTKVVKTQA